MHPSIWFPVCDSTHHWAMLYPDLAYREMWASAIWKVISDGLNNKERYLIHVNHFTYSCTDNYWEHNQRDKESSAKQKKTQSRIMNFKTTLFLKVVSDSAKPTLQSMIEAFVSNNKPSLRTDKEELQESSFRKK